MATRTVLVDDLDGSDAHNSITFSVDGVYYEIDLSDANAAKFRECLAPYTEAARRVTAPAANNVRTIKPRNKTAAYAEQLRAIRDWARKQGHDISDRGRIPETIIEEFNRAHAPKPKETPLQEPAPRRGGGGNNKAKKGNSQVVEALFSHQD